MKDPKHVDLMTHSSLEEEESSLGGLKKADKSIVASDVGESTASGARPVGEDG